MVHNFAESLAYSHKAEDEPFWKETYEKAFPGMLAMPSHRQDGDHQRAGIDRSIIRANSEQILIDEKVRGRSRTTGKVYEDIALEYWSDKGRKVRGWVCKPLRAHYIAYAIAPLGICYLLPVIQLRQAWKNNRHQWVAAYKSRQAYNRDGNRSWVTEFVPVPAHVLLSAISECLTIRFTPCEAIDD